MTERGLFDSGSVPENYRRHLQPVLFEPWAARLVEFAQLERGQTVLDVASGTGVVARLAATAVGPTGTVIASDISALMLQQVWTGADPAGAAIQLLECSATDIPLGNGSVGVVFCQQGFPFIPDRAGAAREFHRVLRAGGTAAVAVWATGARLDPFDSYAEVVREQGLEEMFGRSASNAKLTMSEADVADALLSAGFADVDVTLESLTVTWPSAADEVSGIFGTPYGRVVDSLPPDRREAFLGALTDALTRDTGLPQPHTTTSVLGRATR